MSEERRVATRALAWTGPVKATGHNPATEEHDMTARSETTGTTRPPTDSGSHPLTYRVTLTDTGEWMHSEGSDFLFAYIPTSWDAGTKEAVKGAFVTALTMSTTIKAAVLKESGKAVEGGLYLLDEPTMSRAITSIDGMGMTDADQQHQSGSGTAASITGEFFSAVLGGLGGDVAPLLAYLTTQMGDVQAETRQAEGFENFGTVIGLISVMPGLDVVTTTFQYVFSSQETSAWFVKVNCGSVEHESYDYRYTVVDYNYAPIPH